MAVTNDELIIAIQIESGKAASEINKVEGELKDLNSTMKDVQASSAETSKAVGGTGLALVKLQAAIEVAKMAYDVYKNTLGDTVKSYFAAIDADRKLANSLAINGKFTKDAVERFKEFATEMQRNSTLADDFVMDLAAQATATGRTEEQTKSLIKAAAGLAAMTGTDVKGAFNALLQTYKGVSRGVDVLDPTIKGLTETQLKNGEAVAIVAKKYGAFAKEDMTTVEGKAKVLANAFDDLKEAVGEIVAKIFGLGESTGALAEHIANLTKYLQDNKDDIILWGDAFMDVINDVTKVFALFGTAVSGIMDGVISSFNTQLLVVQKGLNLIGVVSDETVTKTENKVASLNESIKEQIGAFEAGLSDLMGDGDNDNLAKAPRKVDDITSAAERLQAQFKGTGSSASEMSDKAKSAMEDLGKFVSDLTAKVDQIGIGKSGQIEAQAKALQEQLAVIEKKARAEGVAGAALEAQLTTARELIKAQADKTLTDERLKASKQLIDDNKQLADQNKQDGMLAQDLIADQLRVQLELVDAKQKQLEFEGLINGQNTELLDKLNAQRDLLKESAEKKSKAAPPREFEEPMQAGKEIAGLISDSFAGAMGMATGVGEIVGAANAVVDFIPQMLDSITGLINKITDLPTVIMDAVKNLLNSLDKFVAEFIPNLINAIGGILDAIVAFVEKIPDTFITMLEKIPEMLMGLFDKLPALVERLIPALITAMPKIAIALINFMVKDAPRIAVKMVEVLAKEIPKAIIAGLKEAFKSLMNMFKTFKLPKIDMDPAAIAKNLKKAFAQLSGATSKLFAVEDLTGAAANKSKDLVSKVADAGKAVADKIKGLWDWLKDLWGKLLQALKAVWMWVWGLLEKAWAILTDLFKMAWEGLKQVWSLVYDTIIKPAWALLQGVWENVIKLFEGVLDVMKVYWNTMMGVFKAVWDIVLVLFKAALSVMKVYWDTMMVVFKAVWQLIQVYWDSMMSILKVVWDVVMKVVMAYWNSMMDQLKNIWNVITQVWNTLMDLFQGKISLFQAITDIFRSVFDGGANALKIVADLFANVGQIFASGLERVAGIFSGVFNSVRDIFQGVISGFSGAFDKLGDIFRNTIKPIFDSLSGAFSGIWDGFKNIFNKIIDLFKSLRLPEVKVGGKVLGKSFDFTLIPDITLIPGIANVPHFAKGGIVNGQSATSGDSILNDKILAMLSPGEAVIPRSAMEIPAIAAFVKDIIAGKIPIQQFADGGMIGNNALSNNDSGITFQRPMGQGMAPQQPVQNNVYNITQNIKIENSGGQMDENFVRTKIMPVIRQGLRRDTLDGKLIISDRGIF